MQLEEYKKRQSLAQNQDQQLGQSFVGGTSSVLISAPDKDEAAGFGHRPANNHDFYKLELLGLRQPRAVCALSC